MECEGAEVDLRRALRASCLSSHFSPDLNTAVDFFFFHLNYETLMNLRFFFIYECCGVNVNPE